MPLYGIVPYQITLLLGWRVPKKSRVVAETRRSWVPMVIALWSSLRLVEDESCKTKDSDKKKRKETTRNRNNHYKKTPNMREVFGLELKELRGLYGTCFLNKHAWKFVSCHLNPSFPFLAAIFADGHQIFSRSRGSFCCWKFQSSHFVVDVS